MDIKLLKNAKKVKCYYSNIENFTEGREYIITSILNKGFYLEGDNGSEHYVNKLKCDNYIFNPIYNKNNSSSPPHYQGSIQPIDLINAQDLNFNLGNVVKYVCRAGKKKGENILSDLEKAKDYINFEIERVKQWINDNARNKLKRKH